MPSAERVDSIVRLLELVCKRLFNRRKSGEDNGYNYDLICRRRGAHDQHRTFGRYSRARSSFSSYYAVQACEHSQHHGAQDRNCG